MMWLKRESLINKQIYFRIYEIKSESNYRLKLFVKLSNQIAI